MIMWSYEEEEEESRNQNSPNSFGELKKALGVTKKGT